KRAFEAIKPYASLEVSRTSFSGIVIAALHPAITSMAGPVESQPIGRSCFNASILEFLLGARRPGAAVRKIVYLGDSSLQCVRSVANWRHSSVATTTRWRGVVACKFD